MYACKEKEEKVEEGVGERHMEERKAHVCDEQSRRKEDHGMQ